MARTAEEIKLERERQAASIVRGAEMVAGFRVMDEESEAVLEAALEQFDGNERNHVSLNRNSLKKPLAQYALLHCDKLKLHGAFNGYYLYGSDILEINLSESGKTYFSRKHDAIERNRTELEGRKKLESNYLTIQSMSLDELKKLYLQALQVNNTLNESLDCEKAQLAALRNLFASGEDGIAVQKEIMRLVEENGSHHMRDLIIDKGADLVVAGVLEAIKLWLTSQGVSCN